jgi:ABC-type Fe3+ transport system permease subunit
MFKQRLIHSLLFMGILIGGTAASLGLMFLLEHLRPQIRNLLHTTVFMWIMLTVMAGFFMAVIYQICKGIWYLIEWLFVEPYRDYKKKKKENLNENS